MRLDVYSHSFMISEAIPPQKKVIEKFCGTLVQYEMEIKEGVRSYSAKRVFASSDPGRNYYRLHINSLKGFLEHLAYHQIKPDEYETVVHEAVIEDRHRITLKVLSLDEPRDPQPAIIQHILNDGYNKIVTLQTGKGKTFLTKYSFKELGVRSAFFMKGSFIERWIPDMDESFDLRGQAILNVRGKEALSSVMHMALDGTLQKTKAIFISITTYNTYVNDVETYGVSETYPIAPGEFFDKLNIGMAVLDEGHQNPHQVMKIFCYTHVPKFVTLSATLDTMDAFMNKIYELMYPREERCNGDYYDKYIAVTTIKFQLNRPNRIRYKGFGGAYSHTTFEASMMTHKNKVEMDNYLKLIAWSVKEKFVDVMEKGQKLLVFCGTIKFCTLVQKHLQKLFPQLTVGRYVGGDKMSVFDASDIIVSTVLSAGTAVDILNLRISIMTTAIDSQQSCEQVLGRTRRMKGWPEVTPQFFYFCCTSIDKHVKYDKNKQEFFRTKVLSHGSEQAPVMV